MNLFIKGSDGKERDIVLGHDTVAGYEADTCFLGATVGPIANRTKDAVFEVDGVKYQLDVNDNENNLHSHFTEGFHKLMWTASFYGNSVTFKHEKKDMAMGHPGNMKVKVTYTLTDDNEIRLDYEGESALGKNAETFRASEQALIDGKTLLMYPEAGHQDKRWLGTFSFGYTKMAFEAAELGNFEKEVFILPACNHYSHYFGMRNRMLVKFGTPISLQPYYELYKTKPRTAQREVNKLVREQISGLMLDIRDLDNYDAIDFIRTTYGIDYAKTQGVNPDDLPNRLLSDKNLVARLDEAYKSEDTYLQATVASAYEIARVVRKGIDDLGITEAHLRFSVNPIALGFQLLMLLILLPLWIFSWWPSMLVYWIPMSIFKAKMKDPMFEGTLLFGSAALFTLPLFSLITLLVTGFCSGWVPALIYVALFPFLMLFCWKYAMFGKKTLQTLKCLVKPSSVDKLKRMRKDMYAFLNETLDILKKKHK